MKNINKWTILLFVSFCFFHLSCDKDDTTAIPESTYVIQSPVTQRLMDSSDLISRVFHDTLIQVTDGVKETDIHYLSKEGYSMRVYILQVDLNTPALKLVSGMPYGASTITGTMQPLPKIAQYYDSAHHQVVGAINGDFFNVSTGVPRGILEINGNVLKDTWFSSRGETFLAVLPNDEVMIGSRDQYETMKRQFKYAVGAGQLLVKDHKIDTDIPVFTEVAPRTGAGLTDDNVLYFVVADGRDFYWSNGLTMPQLADLLHACGTETAINLDGGGSSTFLIRNPLAPVLQVRNKPSDGSNRALGQGWLIISTK